jgi:hypothetical protein
MSKKQECSEKMLMVLHEKSKLMGKILLSDLALREKLSDDLRLSSVTNNGYLMLEKFRESQVAEKAKEERMLQDKYPYISVT